MASNLSRLCGRMGYVAIGRIRRQNFDLSTRQAQEAAYYDAFSILELPENLTDYERERIADAVWDAVQRVAAKPNPPKE
ncbi:hypothetical protein ACF1A5_13360 [Streptomyces sp. NPDC014864]|uniref:hypothetical protein n=1 Tax=Streptomyces sp. NPDC014864 TaxID=3364924 RepID=UPI0036F8135D